MGAAAAAAVAGAVEVLGNRNNFVPSRVGPRRRSECAIDGRKPSVFRIIFIPEKTYTERRSLIKNQSGGSGCRVLRKSV